MNLMGKACFITPLGKLEITWIQKVPRYRSLLEATLGSGRPKGSSLEPD
jgi:hypothetical protein